MKLSKEQTELITKNHNIIYGFAKSRNLNLQEYYDILAIAVCEAVLKYDSTKSKLTTFLYIAMDNAVKNYKRTTRARKRFNDSMLEYVDEYCDTISDESVYMSEIIDRLDALEKRIVYLRLKGYSQVEIGEELDMTQPQICRSLGRIKCKLMG